MSALWSTALAEDPYFDGINEGWEDVATRKLKSGERILIQKKRFQGVQCGRASVDVGGTTSRLMFQVITDVPAVPDYVSETMVASRFLKSPGDWDIYYQHLDLPAWTFSANRYWILRGDNKSSGDKLEYRWNRIEWREQYPELVKEIERDFPNAIEPPLNFGSWQFTEANGLVHSVYTLCNDPGGALPKWIVERAALSNLPGVVYDIVSEARKRAN